MIQLTQKRVAGSRMLALGLLLAALMVASLLLAAKPAHAATTFTVNSTGDKNDLDFPFGTFDGSSDGKCNTGGISGIGDDECTLRAAIQEANKTLGADTINFDIPGTSGVATISAASGLPTITEAVTIDGYSQPGAKPNTLAVGNDAVLKIELRGPGSERGLRIEAANSTVKGLVINRWGDGISISGSGATGNKVTGNYLGTDASGTQDLGNSYGVFIYASNNTVGGTTAGARNVISANSYGVFISGFGGNKVMGNYVGTDASGTQDLGNSSDGVRIDSAPNNTVGGTTAGARNVISANDLYGVRIEGANTTGNKVTGNYVGTDKNGITDLGNTYYGVFIYGAPNNAVGGATVGERNVISGNNRDGVRIYGAGATGNEVMGNHVGTDKNGTAPLANSLQGVYIYEAPNNTVGGATAGARNVISANGVDGVQIYGAAAKGNRVMGNYVGTDASGTKDLGNSFDGVYIYYAPNNVIGGATAGARNVISGNNREGVIIDGAASTGNKVIGNYVGTDKNGTAPLGNSEQGVFILDASNNAIGGTQAGERNVISNNGYDGVTIYGSLGNSATGNRVLLNSIFSNGGLGIDLIGTDGPTANDPKDPDAGPNNLQNKPVLTSAKTSSTSTTVQGTLNSTPNKTFRVEFFSSPSGEEGQAFRGQKSVTTDANGNASFTFSSTNLVEVGRRMTATATDPAGNTSEFSAARTVVAQ